MARRRVVITHLQVFDIRSPVVYIPYIYGTLRSYAGQFPELSEAWDFAEPVWRLRDLDTMLGEVGEPDLLGCSVYMWNHRNSHRLARAVKERFPRCLVVFGGPHVPNDPSDYLERHPWVDLLVHGEGEDTFSRVLRAGLEDSPDWEQVPGISYRREGRQRFTAPASRMALDFPGPYAAGILDPFLDRARAELPDAVLHGCLETNRGCPYSCAFCDWGMATMTRLRQFSVERVLGEMEWLATRGVASVILTDANFGILPRDLGFAEKAVDLKRVHGFPRNFLPLGFAKNNKDRAFEVNRVLQEGGLDEASLNVNFSLQSMSQDALDAIQRQNIPLDNYRALSDRYSQAGYRLMPDLIFPLPGESLDSFKRGYADLASWDHVTRIMVYPCAILPNAPMAKPAYREKWGLQTRLTVLASQRPLQLEAPDAEWEEVETVVSTSLVTEREAAEARSFVALVDALELAGLGREWRRAAGRLKGMAPADFYSAVMDWQVRHQGLLFSAMAQAYLRGQEHPEEPMWMGTAFTREGEEMQSGRALLADALRHEERFLREMGECLREILGEGPEIGDLLRYQRDRWITPAYDPHAPAEFEYAWDWPAFLESRDAPLRPGPLRVRYRPSEEWLSSPFLGVPEGWQVLTNLQGVDPRCVHDDARREVERAGQGATR